MKRILFSLIAFLATISVNAQILAWDFNGAAGSESTIAAGTVNTNLNGSSVSRGGGLTTSALANSFCASDFTASGTQAQAITNGDYMQFTVNAKSGYTVSLSTLDVNFRRSSTGPNTFLWQYSLDGFATAGVNIGSAISYTATTSNGDAQTQINLGGISALQNVGSATTITFRLYGYGASATTGTFGIGRLTGNDLAIGGSLNLVASALSDVSAAAGGEPTSISSLVNSSGAASSNFNFTVTDDVTGNDALPTLISQIVINQGTGNDVADWTQAIAGAELSDGTNTQTGTVNATNITFSSINTLLLGNILDGASKTFTLKVWLKTSLGGTLPTTVDGLNLAFKVNGGSFTTVPATSTIMNNPGTTVESGATNNAVDVVATALNFTTAFAPTTINVLTNFTTPGVVRAQDANGNTDLGVTSSVSISNSAAYSTANNPGSFAAGVLTFPANFQFVTGGGATTISVDDANAGTTNATSGSITVNVPVPTLATSLLIPNFICPGSAVSVPYTATNFGSGNVFTAQLSDASGSFASPTSIGSITSTTSGTISATIPANTPSGSGYRIRVVGSNPSFNGSDNGTNITIQYSNSTPLFTESMGTVGANTGIATHETNNGFDNDGFTMSGSGDIRTSTPSTGYTGASGAGNVFLTSTAGTNFRIDGINTLGLSPMVLYMGIFKSTTGETGSNLQLEVSSNGGTSWTTIPWTTLAGNLPNTATWNQVKVTGALPQSATVSLRFTNLSNTVQFRLDDINVYSGTATTFSVSPTGPVTQCGGTVALTASPSGQSYNWSNSQTTQSISVGSTGSYTVTITDAFGCSAANGPVSVTINTATLPSIKINSTNSTICAGVPQSFSVGATTDAGVTPTYQWKLNGTNVAVGTTYSPASLAPNDVVNCYMNSSASCISQTTVMSNTFTVRPTITGTTATVFTENFGSSASNVDFSVYTSATNPTLAFSGLGDVRNSTSSTGYAGASGNSNAFLTQNGSSPIGEKNLVISNINTTNAFPNKLTFGMNKNTNADNGNDLLVEYSLDGISYFSVGTVTVPTGSGTGGTAWHLVTFDNALPYATNLRLRFRNVTPTTVQYRVDDVTLVKYNTFTASVTPTGPTTFCSGGSVTLNAAPTGLTYLWSNAATANNISATASGTYTVSITDGVGCKSSASQAVTVNDLPSLAPSASPSTICNGASTTLDANATAGSGTITTYAWSSGIAGNAASGTVSPTSNTTYDVTVTNSNNCSASGSVAVTVNNCGANTWLGNTTQWINAGNWSNGYVPTTCSDDAVIPTSPSGGFFPLIGIASIQVGNLTVEEGASITVNNVSLSVCGNLTGGAIGVAVINGNASGRLVLNGSSAQTIDGQLEVNTIRISNGNGVQLQSGAGLDVHTSLELETGAFDVSNGQLTFRSSSANSYAILDNFSSGFTGVLFGNATAQRYVPVGGLNQHYFGTPITGATFGQLGASGTPGFVIPTANCDQTQVAPTSPYGNVFQWHDDVPANASCLYNGWEVKTGGVTQPGRGYSVYLPGGTFSITGNVNQGNNYTVNGLNDIGWQSNTLQTTGFFPPAYESGWHIVANPFLAPITLNGHSGNFDAAAVWVTTGPFAGSYQPISITGGTLAPFQGFIVHRSASGPAPFTFSKTECVTTPGVTFAKTASEHALNIQVSGNGFNDITYVEFNSSASNGYDVELDSRKPLSVLGQPTLFTFNTNTTERLSVNVNRSITETSEVPMSFIPGANGTFTFSTAGINSFDPTSYILLEDKKTGQWIDLRQNPTYTFTSTTSDAHARFVLHFTPAAVVGSNDASCEGQGQINITQPGTANWNYTVANSNNVTISSGSLNQSNPVTVSAPSGVYTITLVDNNGYTVVKNLQINGASPIAATMTASATAVEAGENITFNSTANNAVTTEWNFGDGTTQSTATATHNYASEGVYTVTLTVTNAAGCTGTTQQQVTVTAKAATGINNLNEGKLAIWSNANRVYVDFSKQKISEATVEIYNILGQKVSSEKWGKSSIYSRELNNLDAGYVIVSVKTELGVSTKKVFITGSK